jgi:glycosyltransferase involved in cell wall biosynthesis
MISHWFDFDLFEGVVRARPGLRFVLVGPHDPRTQEQVDRIAGLDNVELLGERPSGTMPSYVQSFDVGTVWFQVNDMTRAVTPLKVYEYLAAGKPVVSTPLPACEAEPTVHTAGSVEDFASAIDAALAEPDGESRRAVAREHDWQALLQPLIDSLEAKGLTLVP